MIEHNILCSDDAWRNSDIYSKLYEFSIQHPEKYWEAQIDRLSWAQRPSQIMTKAEDGTYHWFADGKINACYNCVDRHEKLQPNKIALIWQSEDIDVFEKISFKTLKEEVCRFANAIKKIGLTKKSYVTIYMPMIPEGVYACLACARLGIRYTAVFSGFSPNALALRMDDSKSDFVITCDSSKRGGKVFPVKKNVDEAREICKRNIKSLVVRRQKSEISWNKDLDYDYYDIAKNLPTECEIAETESLSELFMLYTSGSVGKPKGVVHGTGGFLLFALMSFKYFFDINKDSIFWCSGDIGWLGGHEYSMYAPLANGTTTLIFEGMPTYPRASIFCEIIDKHQVTSFNTAPTAIRAMMKNSAESIASTKRTSLKSLGVFGEILNKEAWNWYFHKIGNEKCTIVNMWGQTEIGGVSVAPLCKLDEMIASGHVGKPFFGCEFVLKDCNGEIINAHDEQGSLFIKSSMPGMLLGIFGDKDAVKNMYYNGGKDDMYCTGDGAYFDHAGNLWITGRNDDVLNVSGHRISPIEVEEVISKSEIVSEASVVGFPHEIKGDGIFAFVVLKKNISREQKENASDSVLKLVAKTISPITKPDVILIVDDLPKTISGKIMRRVLRKIAAGETEDFADLSTIANPSCINDICVAMKRIQK